MRSVTVAWQPEKDRFTVDGSHRGHGVSVNAPHDGPPTGFSPTELLLAGAGACSAWDVVEILRKQRQPVTGLDVRVDGTQAGEPPWQYERLRLHFTVAGDALSRSLVERAIQLSVDRYCSVLATVRPTAAVDFTFEVIDATGAAPPPAGVPAGREG